MSGLTPEQRMHWHAIRPSLSDRQRAHVEAALAMDLRDPAICITRRITAATELQAVGLLPAGTAL